MLATGREPCNAHDRGHAAPALRLSLSMPSCGPLRSIAPGRYGPRQRHPARSGQSANRVREQALWADSGHSTPATMRRMSNERAKSTISVPALEGRRKSTAGKRKERSFPDGCTNRSNRPKLVDWRLITRCRNRPKPAIRRRSRNGNSARAGRRIYRLVPLGSQRLALGRELRAAKSVLGRRRSDDSRERGR